MFTPIYSKVRSRPKAACISYPAVSVYTYAFAFWKVKAKPQELTPLWGLSYCIVSTYYRIKACTQVVTEEQQKHGKPCLISPHSKLIVILLALLVGCSSWSCKHSCMCPISPGSLCSVNGADSLPHAIQESPCLWLVRSFRWLSQALFCLWLWGDERRITS